MATAQQLIDAAISQIGYKESPAGSNRTKYGQWYGMDGEPWCDMFVAWCANEVGMLDEVGKYAYCPYHVDHFKARGQWVEPGDAQPGDICFFTAGGVASHVGIVEWVDGRVIHTIEGNTSVTSNDNGGAVMRRERLETGAFRIMGYGRPAYDETTKRKARKMAEFLIQPDGQARMDYVCGDRIHPLTHPDEMTAVQEVYRKCYGEEIPCFAYGSPEAPWASRLYDALRREL